MRKSALRLAAVALASLALAGAASAEERAWELIQEGPPVIKARPRAGSDIREVWAEGDMNASARDVEAALTDVAHYASFMPYMKESRDVAPRAPDGASTTYLRLQLPIVGGRDYVLRTRTVTALKPDGTGRFESRWAQVAGLVPERSGVKRLKVNEGSWVVTPLGPTRCHAIYRFAVDPGGWLPNFAADMGNKTATEDTFRSVEREAQKRAKSRPVQAAQP